MDNHGYPLKAVMTRQSPYDIRWDFITVDFNLRWSSVIRTWQDNMKSLKVFRMGSWGDFETGVGRLQEREYLLQYMQFDAEAADTPWIEWDFRQAMMDDYDDGKQRYEDSRAKDEEALRLFMHAVAERNLGNPARGGPSRYPGDSGLPSAVPRLLS